MPISKMMLMIDIFLVSKLIIDEYKAQMIYIFHLTMQIKDCMGFVAKLVKIVCQLKKILKHRYKLNSLSLENKRKKLLIMPYFNFKI